MSVRRKTYEECLKRVVKPARYLGKEPNAVRKDWRGVDVRVALAFPDIYEIGMSHLGSRILYEVVNSLEWALAERVFAPWLDMEECLRESGIPLQSLESRRPLGDFDIAGFSIQHELVYTTVLNMLDLGGVPLTSDRRRGWDIPLVIAGGPCAFAPEPIAPFFDVIVPGDGEDAIVKLMEAYRRFRSSGRRRSDLLIHLATENDGFYVPSLYSFSYGKGPVVTGIEKLNSGVPDRIKKNVVKDIDGAPYPLSPIIPLIEIVHDRPVLEIRRGCGQGCRFCQAGMTSRPVRERSAGPLLRAASSMFSSTGYDTISLLALSTGDYSRIGELLLKLGEEARARRATISLPSLRVETLLSWGNGVTAALKKGGLTLAPETGSDRLRAVINKSSTSEELIRAAGIIYASGWRSIKLYFIIGLPTEKEEDLESIACLARDVSLARRGVDGRAGGVGLSVSYFIPRPHTPFQWRPMEEISVLSYKRSSLSDILRSLRGEVRFHDLGMSFLEAALSRGDRRMADVVLGAWRRGCRFDSWSDMFDLRKWREAFADSGLDPGDYAHAAPVYGDFLAWDHIDTGLRKDFLINEDRKADGAIMTGDCVSGECSGCGVCASFNAKNVLASENREKKDE